MQVSKEAEEGQRYQNGVVSTKDMGKSAEVDGEHGHDHFHHQSTPLTGVISQNQGYDSRKWSRAGPPLDTYPWLP